MKAEFFKAVCPLEIGDTVAIRLAEKGGENAADVVDYLPVAKEYFHLSYAVEHGIMLGIFHAPLVNIVAYHVFRSEF